MVSVFAPFTDMTPAEFRRVTEVTYLGTVHGTRAALEHMRPRDRGVIVQVGSALAHRSIPLQSAYCGAKHAMVGFTESVRCELLATRSRVAITVVHLPALNTPQFDWAPTRLAQRPQPVPPIYQPEVAARAIVEAARRHHKEHWVSWSTTRAILANRIAPALVDRLVAARVIDAQLDPRVPGDDTSNLWEPAIGAARAHGRFDGESRDG